MHRAQAIRDAVVTKLQPLIALGVVSQVYFGAEQADELPAIGVMLGDDTRQNRNSAFIDWQLTVFTDILVGGTDADVDAIMLATRLNIHKAIMADTTLGLPYVIDVNPIGQQEPERSNEGDRYTSATRVSWQVTYRSSLTDPSN